MTSREAFYLWSMVLLLLGYVIPNDKVTNFIIWTDLEDWTVLAGLIERVRSLSKMSNVSDTINIYNYSSAGLPTENVYRVDRHLFSDTCQQQEGSFRIAISVPLENKLILLSDTKKGKPHIVIEETITCIKYYQFPQIGNIRDTITKVRSCDTSEAIYSVVEGIVMQGEWSDLLLIAEAKSDLGKRLGFLKQTAIECDAADSFQTLDSYIPKDDFVNLTIEPSESVLIRRRFNWILPRNSEKSYLILRPYLRRGDNMVILKTKDLSYTLEEYILYRPFMYEVKSKENVSYFVGIEKDMIDTLSVHFNFRLTIWSFSYSFHYSVDGNFGAEIHGRWNGLIGMVATWGNDVKTNIGSIRILRIFFWLTVIILVATYSGNLTAHLAVEKFQKPFTTLQGLADDNTYSLLILKSTSTETLLKNSKDGVYKQLWDKVKKNPDKWLAKSQEEAWTLLEKEPSIVYSGDKTGLEQHRSPRKCADGVILQENYFKMSYGIVLTEDATYKRHFDIMIMNIIQSGLTEYWTRIHIDHTPCGAGVNPSAVERSLTVEDIFYLFAALAVDIVENEDEDPGDWRYEAGSELGLVGHYAAVANDNDDTNYDDTDDDDDENNDDDDDYNDDEFDEAGCAAIKRRDLLDTCHTRTRLYNCFMRVERWVKASKMTPEAGFSR
ncbi:hypothetical protein LSH36_435g00013 [Paralvinella palmiformis]|uniref:Ionotropic glutamate receptor C-terminal domain-containing protein n=1 Tax=Paralvinella palmiformis TaxID=53620 RepID=A0AAD9JBK8_9ANNE|nr:hypothetical protein LSH36_435g00013 [Paralvinella palmiformis]